MRGRVKFTSVNKMEAMYERLRVNVKVERGSTFNIYNVHATFHTLPLFYLRTYILRACASKDYATVEIRLRRPQSAGPFLERVDCSS